jgi:hypothetical protein
VPATVLAVAKDCADVDILGVRARIRCAAGQRPGAAMACLRPEDLAAVPTGTVGAIDGRIARTTFRGAVSELDVVAARPPDHGTCVLRLDMPEPQATPTAMGAPLGIVIRDGWVIPGG